MKVGVEEFGLRVEVVGYGWGRNWMMGWRLGVWVRVGAEGGDCWDQRLAEVSGRVGLD